MKEEIKQLKQINQKLQYENYKLKRKITELKLLIRESEEDIFKEQEYNDQLETIKCHQMLRKNLMVPLL